MTDEPTNQVMELPAPKASGPSVQAIKIRQTEMGGGLPMPVNMAEVVTFAQLMAQSGEAVRKHCRGRPGVCLGIVMQALRWEMEPFSVANKSYVVNDSLAYEAQLIAAVVNTRAALKSRPKPRYVGEGAKRKCIIEGTLQGENAPSTYESPEIGAITIKNSPLWKGDPDQQLHYFSIRAWARRHCPEVILGVMSVDEAYEARAEDVTPQQGPQQTTEASPRSPQQALDAFAAAAEPEREPGDEREEAQG